MIYAAIVYKITCLTRVRRSGYDHGLCMFMIYNYIYISNMLLLYIIICISPGFAGRDLVEDEDEDGEQDPDEYKLRILYYIILYYIILYYIIRYQNAILYNIDRALTYANTSFTDYQRGRRLRDVVFRLTVVLPM